MSTGANRKPHTAVLSSSAALLVALAIGLAADSRVTTSDGGLEHDYSGGQVARLINETAPDWLVIPPRSSFPVVNRIGSQSSASRVVHYRTLASEAEITAFHKVKLAWKGMQWLDIDPVPGDHHTPLAVRIGHSSNGGERLHITIRKAGAVNLVEILIAGMDESETARLTQ